MLPSVRVVGQALAAGNRRLVGNIPPPPSWWRLASPVRGASRSARNSQRPSRLLPRFQFIADLGRSHDSLPCVGVILSAYRCNARRVRVTSQSSFASSNVEVFGVDDDMRKGSASAGEPEAGVEPRAPGLVPVQSQTSSVQMGTKIRYRVA